MMLLFVDRTDVILPAKEEGGAAAGEEAGRARDAIFEDRRR
jgi:hypothetical protein